VHGSDNPVQRAGEVHNTGQQSEAERIARRRGIRTVPGQRDQQRRKRNPAQARVPELRKAQGEQQAGRGG